jgi:hypothetical protein
VCAWGVYIVDGIGRLGRGTGGEIPIPAVSDVARATLLVNSVCWFLGPVVGQGAGDGGQCLVSVSLARAVPVCIFFFFGVRPFPPTPFEPPHSTGTPGRLVVWMYNI